MTEEKIRDEFAKKLIADFKDCLDEWSGMTPSALIDNADVISATQLVRNNVEELASVSDMEYFLRFKHPLQVIRDTWFGSYGGNNFCTDEILHTLWELTDKHDAEQDYELTDEFLSAEFDSESDGLVDRKDVLLARALGYIEKYEQGLDLYDTLSDQIGMTDEEINEMGYEELTEYFEDEPDESPALTM